jgi:hypothetical protein
MVLVQLYELYYMKCQYLSCDNVSWLLSDAILFIMVFGSYQGVRIVQSV